jgi:membrane-associated phospholipid phosphatase
MQRPVQQPRASSTDPTPGYRRRRTDVVVLVVSGLVLAASWLMMGRTDRVADEERAVFHAVNDLPGWMRAPIEPVMQSGWFGAVLIAAIGAVLVGFLTRHPRRGAVAAMAIALAGTAAYVLARLAKHLVGRGRPGDMLEEVRIRGAAASGLGFPSGHAAVSMALILVILPYVLWRWRWALLAIPLIVAVARVYVGAHLPLDVVAGAGIGALAASLTNLAVGVPPRPERVVMPSEGPPAAVEESPGEPVPPPEEAPLGAQR